MFESAAGIRTLRIYLRAALASKTAVNLQRMPKPERNAGQGLLQTSSIS
jgi:hypothetical protein